MKSWRYVVCMLGLSVGATAQQISQPLRQPVAVTTDHPQLGASISIAGGTPVDFEFAEGLSSKTAQVGQRFAIRVVESVLVGTTVVLPVGTLGEGEVIHAARAGAGGKAGELVLSVRFIQVGGTRVPLRGFRFGQSGVSRSVQANTLNAAIAGASVFVPLPPVALLIGGKEVDVAVSTRGSAKVANDTVLPSQNNHTR